ncbi:MAG: SPOR domain-containing protein [Syntrophobacterales bacterium]|nr:MAG: SPOR domain-containing protein [Syntrophobacterales bacterium]
MLGTVMSAFFRTAWLTLLVILFVINPGLLPVDSDGSSHASETTPPARILINLSSSNKTMPVYAVQASACRDEKNARSVLEKLKDKGYSPDIYSWKDLSGSLWYSVLLGVYETLSEAEGVAHQYRDNERDSVYVKSLDPSSLGEVRAAKPSPEGPPSPEEDGHLAGAVKPEEEKGAPKASPDVPEEGQAATEGPREVLKEKPVESREEENIGPEFSYRGSIEFETFFNTGTNQSFKGKNEKNEIRNRLQIRYGTENLFLFSVSNLYLFQTYLNEGADDHYVYSKDHRVARNLRLSSQNAELSFDELYLNYGMEHFRLRAGNQIYGWGTADAFNPTSYFNPSDMREILFRDDDENKVGVPSLSGMFFLGDYTLEAVFVPVHIPTIMAPEGNFWALAVNDSFFLPIIFDEPERLDADIDNVGYGVRLSTSAGGVDMSVSAFRGPDKNQLFLPYEIIFQGPTPVAVRLRPQTSVVSILGLDLSAALGDFVVQLEAAYSPDKAGIVEQGITGLGGPTLPFETDRFHYVSYATGFNYFIPLDRLLEGHTGDTVFTFEWFQSKYLEGGVYSQPITDIVSCKFEDSYFDGRIKTTIKGIFDTKHGGKVFWPEIGYDFQNGFLVEVGYATIWGDRGSTWENDSIFYYFRDNDLLMGKVRYEY